MKKTFKCKILTLLVSATSLLSLSSCNNKTTEEIVIWSFDTTTTDIMVREYKKTNPDAKFSVVPVDGSAYMNLLQAALFVDEDVPDIIWGDYFTRGKLFSLNILEDLSQEPYNLDTSLVSNWVLDLCKNDEGQILGLESGPAPTGLLYKRDIVQTYLGTSDPDELGDLFSTWDDFVNACQTIYDDSNHSVIPFASIGDVYCILVGLTNVPYMKDGKQNIEAVCDAVFPKLYDFVSRGLCGKMDQWVQAYYGSYSSSKYAFNICPAWCMDYNIKKNAPTQSGNLGICMSPGGKMYSFGGTTFSIYKKSNHKLEAWDFIKWALLSEEGQKKTHEEVVKEGGSGGVGTLKTLYNDSMYDKVDPYFGGQKVLKFFVDNMENVNARPLTKYDTTFSDSLGLVLSSMKNGKTAEACKQQVMSELKLKLPELF